uniref:Uncharacterized protein n=1 Tax=Trichobilharzia regenti TaxID=157069 RepID=A0AA85J3S4_TRIRE|nr:unnamed protein product [Trichobilharzia regenti]
MMMSFKFLLTVVFCYLVVLDYTNVCESKRPTYTVPEYRRLLVRLLACEEEPLNKTKLNGKTFI